MKVFLSVDIEGVACVVSREDTKLEGVEYERARKWMTGEANAAIEGALEMGATEIVVADSHGHMRNLLADELNEKALIVRGSPRPGAMMEGLDETFDAAFFVGYHSQAGARGVLSHTYLGGTIYNIRLNGKTVGEPGFNAAIAGHFGVPVALVCGDDTLDAEVKAIMPWTETVITKWALSTLSAKNLTPTASQKKIKEAAKRAIGKLGTMKPLIFDKPVHLEIDFIQAFATGIVADIPGVERTGGRSISYTGTMADILRTLRLMGNAVLGEFFL
jgi:D-amino peptidase